MDSAYLSQSTNLLHRHIEAIEVQRLPAHSGQVRHTHGLLLCEGQVSVHPHLPLWLATQLIQLGDLLIGCSRRAGFLRKGSKIKVIKAKHNAYEGCQRPLLLCPLPLREQVF